MMEKPAAALWLKCDLWLALWGAFGLLLSALVWTYAIRSASADHERATAEVRKSASAAADAYEQYITRSVVQMDQISMQLSQSWEQAGGQLDLNRLARGGMFLDGAFTCVAIADAAGSISSAIHADACPRTLPHSALLRRHRDNNASAMAIGPSPDDQGSVHPLVLFSRRLETAEGGFGGLVLLSVRASYFTHFYLHDDRQGSLVAMVSTDNALRAVQATGAASASFPHGAQLWSASAGVRVLAADGPDGGGQAWALSWRRSSGYPIAGMVAMPLAATEAQARERWRVLRNAAIAATIALLACAVLGMLYSRRAMQRYQSREDIRLAYRAATESANDGFYLASPVRDGMGQVIDFDIVDCNERGARFYGMGRAAMVGKRLSSFDAGVFGNKLFEVYLTAMQTGLVEDERQMPGEKGLAIGWGRRRIVRVGDALAITLQDISERKAHVAELMRMSNEDLLTGLPNRSWLMAYLPTLLAEARGEIALLYIDLDDFKHVNETLGHPAGDELLKSAAQRLRAVLRPDDVLVRFGGDEFVALLAPAEGEQHSSRVAARVVDAFTAPFVMDSGPSHVGASVGIAVYPRDGRSADELISNSGVAMESAKVEGKGQCRPYAPALSRTVQSRAQLKQSLVDAIARDEFMLHYQARVDARTGELCSMEALLRWVHPVRGLVSPLEFIPLAEASGLILQIGAVVMDKACAQMAAWRAAGLALVPVSVNVSPRQFSYGQVHAQLSACLARHDIAAGLLEVEITESAMMGDQEHIIGQLDAIRSLGVKLHVDDFGTGYSSLSQLQKLRLDVLKVDRAFTNALTLSREGTVFFQAIVSMAHALGMSVVAEGVETVEQLQILQQLSCNEVQGYYIARPLPADEMRALMQRRFLFPPIRPVAGGGGSLRSGRLAAM